MKKIFYSGRPIFRWVLLLLASTTLMADALAIDAQGRSYNRGIGSETCGDYVTADLIRQQWFEHWFMGYISGVNNTVKGKADFTDGISASSMVLWIGNYCKQNPLTNISDAINALLREIESKR